MEPGNVTTPFGRRAMTLGMFSSQAAAQDIAPDTRIDKWKIYRSLCTARAVLGVSDRALSVLNALLSFHPRTELMAEDALVVFPSNRQLSLRTHGMAETTLRRHLAALVDAGLVIRKDSPNGKRYARKGRGGEIDDAYGFSLAPLLARAEEIERIAADVEAERLLLQRLRERLTLTRRDIAKLIVVCLEEGVAGDWPAIEEAYRRQSMAMPRKATAQSLAATIEEMALLRDTIVKLLEKHQKTKKQSGNADQTERHIQNSNPNYPSDLEPRFETKPGRTGGATVDQPHNGDPEEKRKVLQAAPRVFRPQERNREQQEQHDFGKRPYPLGLVLQACPEIVPFGPGGAIGNWRDLMSAAVVVRSMLGVSASAYEEACAVLGPENAATVIACILERAGHINSAGGYLRDLTRRAERDAFSLGPMVMALVRHQGTSGLKAG